VTEIIILKTVNNSEISVHLGNPGGNKMVNNEMRRREIKRINLSENI